MSESNFLLFKSNSYVEINSLCLNPILASPKGQRGKAGIEGQRIIIL